MEYTLNNRVGVVILAAGKGTRMGVTAQLPKVLMPMAGKPMIAHLIEGIKGSVITAPPVIVIAPDLYIIRDTIGPSCEYAIQESPLGTGHAILSAQSKLLKYDHVLAVCGDHPLLTHSTIDPLVVRHLEQGADITVGVVRVPNFEERFCFFEDYGRFLRDRRGHLAKIVERKDDASEENEGMKEVNPAYYVFKTAWLWPALSKITRNNAQREYLLTDVLEIALQEGKKIAEVVIGDPEEAIGINTLEQLTLAERIIKERLDTTARFHTQPLPI